MPTVSCREASVAPTSRTDVRPATPPVAWKILIVDDDAMVRRVSARMMPEGEILMAENGAEACQVLEQHGADSLDCVLLDMKMPGLSFEESLEGIRRLCPDLPIVACSGNGADSVGPDFSRAPRTGFLGKPFTRKELHDAIGSAVKGSPD